MFDECRKAINEIFGKPGIGEPMESDSVDGEDGEDDDDVDEDNEEEEESESDD